MNARRSFPGTAQPPRRVRLKEGVLVLPPATLRDLPPGGSVGTFLGVAALRFTLPAGVIAMFLHDLDAASLAAVLDAQRRQAEAQLGRNYARRALWWETLP